MPDVVAALINKHRAKEFSDLLVLPPLDMVNAERISNFKHTPRSGAVSEVRLRRTWKNFNDQGKVLVSDPAFERFGLADTAIAKTCDRGILVITTDLHLCCRHAA